MTVREKARRSPLHTPLFSTFSFIFSNEKKWDIWNAEIDWISLFVFLPRCGLFVYPKFQPAWDNGTGPTLFQNFTVWGSAGGAQVRFFSFLFLWWFIVHLYLKGDDLLLGEHCDILTALRSQQHHRCVWNSCCTNRFLVSKPRLVHCLYGDFPAALIGNNRIIEICNQERS